MFLAGMTLLELVLLEMRLPQHHQLTISQPKIQAVEVPTHMRLN
jgi:hypothetical protein